MNKFIRAFAVIAFLLSFHSSAYGDPPAGGDAPFRGNMDTYVPEGAQEYYNDLFNTPLPAEPKSKFPPIVVEPGTPVVNIREGVPNPQDYLNTPSAIPGAAPQAPASCVAISQDLKRALHAYPLYLQAIVDLEALPENGSLEIDGTTFGKQEGLAFVKAKAEKHKKILQAEGGEQLQHAIKRVAQYTQLVAECDALPEGGTIRIGDKVFGKDEATTLVNAKLVAYKKVFSDAKTGTCTPEAGRVVKAKVCEAPAPGMVEGPATGAPKAKSVLNVPPKFKRNLLFGGAALLTAFGANSLAQAGQAAPAMATENMFYDVPQCIAFVKPPLTIGCEKLAEDTKNGTDFSKYSKEDYDRTVKSQQCCREKETRSSNSMSCEVTTVPSGENSSLSTSFETRTFPTTIETLLAALNGASTAQLEGPGIRILQNTTFDDGTIPGQEYSGTYPLRPEDDLEQVSDLFITCEVTCTEGEDFFTPGLSKSSCGSGRTRCHETNPTCESIWKKRKADQIKFHNEPTLSEVVRVERIRQPGDDYYSVKRFVSVEESSAGINPDAGLLEKGADAVEIVIQSINPKWEHVEGVVPPTSMDDAKSRAKELCRAVINPLEVNAMCGKKVEKFSYQEVSCTQQSYDIPTMAGTASASGNSGGTSYSPPVYSYPVGPPTPAMPAAYTPPAMPSMPGM